eukprot:2011664-Rhodomonas_salina.1
MSTRVRSSTRCSVGSLRSAGRGGAGERSGSVCPALLLSLGSSVAGAAVCAVSGSLFASAIAVSPVGALSSASFFSSSACSSPPSAAFPPSSFAALSKSCDSCCGTTSSPASDPALRNPPSASNAA